MIILKHLTVERFRLLRELNLHFPQRGSILIQGPNEAGKSTLLECIYFALYGESLTSHHGGRSLDDLILYGAADARVALSLSVGATELVITRTIERGKGQQVLLHVSRLGLPPEEPVTQLDVANERIIAELGSVDSAALRSTFLLEQKGLGRLEALSGKEREATVSRLLGLEQLTSLAPQFAITTEDEQLLKNCSERLHLAELQARIPQLSDKLDQVETALDAVKTHSALAYIAEQEADIAEQEQTLENIAARRLELKSIQGRIQQLKRADTTLADIVSAYDGIAEAQQEIPILEKHLVDLERREREELPAMEKRVAELSELMSSFGTLQHMSNDLLASVDTLKELENELKKYNELHDDLKSLNEQVSHARNRLNEARQALQDLEDRRRAGRPQLEERLERLQTVNECLNTLSQAEERYTQRVTSKTQAEENQARLRKVARDLSDAEQELETIEVNAQKVQQQMDEMEQQERQVKLYRQVEEWQHMKGLSFSLDRANQQVHVAHQQQAKLNQAAMDARATTRRYLIMIIGCFAFMLIGFIIALFMIAQSPLIAAIVGVVALILGIVAGINLQNYRRARIEEESAQKQMQVAIHNVGTMVTAREAAVRNMGGNPDALALIEQEIYTLGGTVPRTHEEAQQILERLQVQLESIGDIQSALQKKQEEVNASRQRVNVIKDAIAALHKEQTRLEELRKKEDWENIEENIRADQSAIERIQQEVTLLAGQEGLPLSSITARLQASPAPTFGTFASGPLIPVVPANDLLEFPDLATLVDSTIKATEREIASLDGKQDLVADLADQVKIHQEALDVLLARQRTTQERIDLYGVNSPVQQLERARDQQMELRSALQTLQDSLRQRVKLLGVSFGQTAISSAEAIARKQLEELQITLGNRFTLQEQHAHYTAHLKELQASLSEHYKQLAKFSNTLGGWIVPLNPFSEALIALRTRCQRELQEANEAGVLQEFDTLKRQEGAARAKIDLCRQEIEMLQERIAGLLVQRRRPSAKNYALDDLLTVWPLLGEYSIQDYEHLAIEREKIEEELDQLEEEELALSKRLQTGSVPLDLNQERIRLEQQERAYETKKWGTEFIKAVNERLLQKALPRTQQYLQQILPLLTSGRYHDVHLVTEPEEGSISGGSLQLSVWDSAAGEFVSKSALSGGAADQLSLALHLAFAIACLPRELNAAPGFMLLDEPLSSFDRSRTRALVDVVTGDSLGQHFEQIVLISHSSAFDPAMFPYHIYMDNGTVVESNLPVVPGLPSTIASSEQPAQIPVTVEVN